MFGIVQPQAQYPLTALYFENYPDLPLTDDGKMFRCKVLNGTEQKELVISNLEYARRSTMLETNANIRFKAESFVLLSDKLYKIEAVQSEELNPYASALSFYAPKRITLTLNMVDNGTEMEV